MGLSRRSPSHGDGLVTYPKGRWPFLLAIYILDGCVLGGAGGSATRRFFCANFHCKSKFASKKSLGIIHIFLGVSHVEVCYGTIG